MDPAVAAGVDPRSNPSPAELARQARQRPAVRGADTQQPTAQLSQAASAERAAPTQAIPTTANGDVPPVRPADLTRNAQFALTRAEASIEPAPTPDRNLDEAFARPKVVERIGPDPQGQSLSAAFDTEALQQDPDPLVRADSAVQGDPLAEGDAAERDNLAPTLGSEEAARLSADRQAQFQQIADNVTFLQSAAQGTSDTPNANPATGEDGSSREGLTQSGADRVAERTRDEDVSTQVTNNDAAGPVLPRGSTLSLVA